MTQKESNKKKSIQIENLDKVDKAYKEILDVIDRYEVSYFHAISLCELIKYDLIKSSEEDEDDEDEE